MKCIKPFHYIFQNIQKYQYQSTSCWKSASPLNPNSIQILGKHKCMSVSICFIFILSVPDCWCNSLYSINIIWRIGSEPSLLIFVKWLDSMSVLNIASTQCFMIVPGKCVISVTCIKYSLQVQSLFTCILTSERSKQNNMLNSYMHVMYNVSNLTKGNPKTDYPRLG